MGVVMASSLPSLLLYQICSKLQVFDFGLLNDELPSLVIDQYGQQLYILSSNDTSSRLAASTDWRCQLFTEFQIYNSRSITSYKLVGPMNFEWTRFFGPILNGAHGTDKTTSFYLPSWITGIWRGVHPTIIS